MTHIIIVYNSINIIGCDVFHNSFIKEARLFSVLADEFQDIMWSAYLSVSGLVMVSIIFAKSL